MMPHLKMGQKVSGSKARPSREVTIYQNNSTTERLIFNPDLQRPHRLDILLSSTTTDEITRRNHTWNPDDRSLNIFVKEDDPYTIHRHPVAQSTDCIRGKIGYTRGLHVWEIGWNIRQRGTHAVVGVATKDAPLHCAGYHSYIGSNPDSWGWDIIRF